MASTKSAEDTFRERLVEFLDMDGAPSQRALAIRAEIHFVHLNKIVKGHVVPGLDLADKICRAIETYLDEFIDDDFRVSVLISRIRKNRKKIA